MGSLFNLIDEPWIPCIQLKGWRTEEYSIRDVFLKANEFREVHCDSPLATVSILRLLLAIVYSATRKVEEYDIEAFWKNGLPLDKIESYLDRWHDRFYLFHPKYPFYQTADLETKNKVGINRIATELASGNNPSLFDHTIDEEPGLFTLAKSTRLLLAAQGFALGFGKSGEGRIGSQKIKPPYLADANLLRGLNIWLAGENLQETILLNLVDVGALDSNDLPPWEMERPFDLRDSQRGKERIVHGPRGILDQLTWQSRLIRLLPENGNGSTGVSFVYITQGRSIDKEYKDLMKAYISSKEKGVTPVSLGFDKAAWRNSHALLTQNKSKATRPAVLSQVNALIQQGVIGRRRFLEMNVVGLATAPNKAGKFLLWRHDRMPVAAVLIEDENLVERLETLISDAEKIATKLRRDARKLCRNYLSLGEGEASADDTEHLLASINPLQSYWARLEGQFYRLLKQLPSDPDGATEQWHNTIEQEAYRAYEESARTLGESVRAITARAKTIPYFDLNKGGKPKKSRKEVQS